MTPYPPASTQWEIKFYLEIIPLKNLSSQKMEPTATLSFPMKIRQLPRLLPALLQDMLIRQYCLWSSAEFPLIPSICGDLSDQTTWIFSGLLLRTKSGILMPRKGGFPGSRPRISTIFLCTRPLQRISSPFP